MNSTHNNDLNNLLQKISARVDSAESNDDLIEAVKYAVEFGAPLKFDNTIPNMLGASGLVMMAVVALLTFVFEKVALNAYSIGAMSVFFIIGISTFLYGSSRDETITDLSSKIFRKDLLLDNGLQTESDKSFLKHLSSTFKEFDRGNHSREFKRVLIGHYAGDEHRFTYHLYHYHYVDRRTVVEVVSDGKGGTRTQTRTVYDHYDRYGIVLPFGFAKGLAILGAGGTDIKGYSYRPASNKFNDLFTVLGETELAAAKFLKPKVVIECEDFSEQFSGLNYEFSKDGELCLSFEDDDLISANRTYGLDNPSAFLEEVIAHTQLPKLNSALNHIHTLMKYSDNNFMEKSS